jgi:ribonuclease VapC
MADDMVLDTSAILAAILQEDGGSQVYEILAPRFVSTVNVVEVRTKLIDKGRSDREIDSALELIDMVEVDFTSAQARFASGLREKTKSAGLSVGDRACLALAAERGAVAMTADKAWKRVELTVRVAFIR